MVTTSDISLFCTSNVTDMQGHNNNVFFWNKNTMQVVEAMYDIRHVTANHEEYRII